MKPLSLVTTLLTGIALLACSAPASAQFTTLHSFDLSQEGGAPRVGPFATGYDGDLYATTSFGYGTVYKITRQGAVTVLHTFGSIPGDGNTPSSPLVLNPVDGYFYGVTASGGSTAGLSSGGDGTIFKISPAGKYAVVHNFGDGSTPADGIYPGGSLVMERDGTLYGTTASDVSGRQLPGGAPEGTIFRMTSGCHVSILHHFGADSPIDGALPTGLIHAKDGEFYGTTLYGGNKGAANGYGTIYRINSGGQQKILHCFQDGTTADDGISPQSNVMQAQDGNFYGTTEAGGTDSYGTIYEMTTTGTVTILHSFGDGSTANDGLQPYGGLAQAWDGRFYGTATAGGAVDEGTVFKMEPNHDVITLHSFGDGTINNDGLEPYGTITFAFDGYLYGMASIGGANGFGTIFKFPYGQSPVVVPPVHTGAGG